MLIKQFQKMRQMLSEIIFSHFKLCQAIIVGRPQTEKYIEPGLSITKMYNMYEQHCASNDILPQERYLYSSIFNYEFNLGFHVPRKDMCDLCEEYKAQSSNSMVSDELEVKYNDHIEGKNAKKLSVTIIARRQYPFFVLTCKMCFHVRGEMCQTSIIGASSMYTT